jgi:hypothetical protein
MAGFVTSKITTAEFTSGLVIENGSWDGASVTTGTITCKTEAAAGTSPFVMRKILDYGFTSNGGTAVNPSISGVGKNQINITFTSSDTGTYYLIGEGV